MGKKCVFAGTFDPPTTGHKKIIDDCLKLFERVVLAVMVNTGKTPLFTEEERAGFLKTMYADDPRVKIVIFEGAVVDLLERENTPFYVRGIRNTIDLEYENANFFANKKLKNDIVTVYLPSEQDNLHISSTLVRNSFKFRKKYEDYIPEEIMPDLLNILKTKNL